MGLFGGKKGKSDTSAPPSLQEFAKSLLTALTVTKQLKAVRRCVEDQAERLKKFGKALNLNFRYGNGCTPLHLSLFSGKPRIAKYLVEKGAKCEVPHVRRNKFTTPTACLAVRSADYRMVSLVLSCGAPVGDADGNGDTALHGAVDLDYYWIVSAMLPYNPDRYVRNAAGKAPIDLVKTKAMSRLLTTTIDPSRQQQQQQQQQQGGRPQGHPTQQQPSVSQSQSQQSQPQPQDQQRQQRQAGALGPSSSFGRRRDPAEFLASLSEARRAEVDAVITTAVAMGIPRSDCESCLSYMDSAGLPTGDINVLLDVHGELEKRREEKARVKSEAAKANGGTAKGSDAAPASSAPSEKKKRKSGRRRKSTSAPAGQASEKSGALGDDGGQGRTGQNDGGSAEAEKKENRAGDDGGGDESSGSEEPPGPDIRSRAGPSLVPFMPDDDSESSSSSSSSSPAAAPRGDNDDGDDGGSGSESSSEDPDAMVKTARKPVMLAPESDSESESESGDGSGGGAGTATATAATKAATASGPSAVDDAKGKGRVEDWDAGAEILSMSKVLQAGLSLDDFGGGGIGDDVVEVVATTGEALPVNEEGQWVSF